MLFLMSGRVCKQAAQENVCSTRGAEQSAGFTCGLAWTGENSVFAEFEICSKGFIKGHESI